MRRLLGCERQISQVPLPTPSLFQAPQQSVILFQLWPFTKQGPQMHYTLVHDIDLLWQAHCHFDYYLTTRGPG